MSMSPPVCSSYRNLAVQKLKGLIFSVRSVVAREPAFWLLYQPYIFWDQLKIKSFIPVRERVVLPDTELVIDGFQGSANSFATVAFKQSQQEIVKLAHHMHSPAQIIQATRRDIPVLLTIREPQATVLSLTSRWPYISVTAGLRSYIAFYSKLRPHAPKHVVSTFESTTQHLDQVVQAINDKFDTHFDLVNTAKVNTELKAKTSAADEAAQRAPIKAAKREEFSSERNQQLLERANLVYQSYLPFTHSNNQ
ncbi:MAG: hypothetical protein AAFR12_15505 [Cyanobacteria bacterium J06626_6]